MRANFFFSNKKIHWCYIKAFKKVNHSFLLQVTFKSSYFGRIVKHRLQISPLVLSECNIRVENWRQSPIAWEATETLVFLNSQLKFWQNWLTNLRWNYISAYLFTSTRLTSWDSPLKLPFQHLSETQAIKKEKRNNFFCSGSYPNLKKMIGKVNLYLFK